MATKPAPTAVAPRPAPKPSSSGEKVIIASKLPMAVELQLCEMVEKRFHHMQNSWTELVAHKVGQVVRINGAAYPKGEPPEGFRDRPDMSAGYALTFGVDKDFWERYVEQNADAPYIRSGAIFAASTRDEVKQRSRKEMAGLFTGLDPVNPKGDPRMPKPLKGIVVEGTEGPTDLDLAS